MAFRARILDAALGSVLVILIGGCATNVDALRERAAADAQLPPPSIKAFPPSEAEPAPLPPPTQKVAPGPFVLGVEDVVTISVYPSAQLDVTQAIRPDGKISVLPTGDLQAAGLTVEQLRLAVRKRLSGILLDPIVNVVVTKYNSRRVAVLGSVMKPGVLRMQSEVTVLDCISQMGGLSPVADLYRAMLFRNDQVIPIDFDALFRKGDLSQNVTLQAGDAIFVPSIRDNKVYVMGEVGSPGVVSWQGPLSVMQVVSLVGGFTKDARRNMVMIVRGGIGEPRLSIVDTASMTREGAFEKDVTLQTGDIVYVPRSQMAEIEDYTDFAIKLAQLALQGEASFILGNEIKQIIQGSANDVGASIILNP